MGKRWRRKRRKIRRGVSCSRFLPVGNVRLRQDPFNIVETARDVCTQLPWHQRSKGRTYAHACARSCVHAVKGKSNQTVRCSVVPSSFRRFPSLIHPPVCTCLCGIPFLFPSFFIPFSSFAYRGFTKSSFSSTTSSISAVYSRD